MSECERFEDALWAAALGEASSPEATAHADHCPSCRGSLRALADAAKGFTALRQVQAPDPRAAIRARLNRPSRRVRLALAFAGGVAACGVALVVLLVHGPTRPTPAADHTRLVAKAPVKTPVVSLQVGSELPAATPVAEARPAPERPRVRHLVHARHVKRNRVPPAADKAVVVDVPPIALATVRELAVAESPVANTDAPGKMAACVNRIIGMALASSLLPPKNENG